MDLHAQNRRLAVPTLRTARLILRALTPDDLDDIARHAGDYAVSKWLVPVPHPYTRSDAEDFLRMDRAGEIGALWVITAKDRLIGAVSIGKELGYWLARSAWGKGYMTEAARAVVDHHFQTTGATAIRSSHFDENPGSRRVLEKTGFLDTGPTLHFSQARQDNVPGRAMELTRARWQDLRDG